MREEVISVNTVPLRPRHVGLVIPLERNYDVGVRLLLPVLIGILSWKETLRWRRLVVLLMLLPPSDGSCPVPVEGLEPLPPTRLRARKLDAVLRCYPALAGVTAVPPDAPVPATHRGY